MGRKFSQRQRETILERDGYKCAYCGGPADVVDHVNPARNGGKATMDNGVAACRSCNAIKGGKLDMILLARGFYVSSTYGSDVSKQPTGSEIPQRPDSTSVRRGNQLTTQSALPIRDWQGTPTLANSPVAHGVLRRDTSGNLSLAASPRPNRPDSVKTTKPPSKSIAFRITGAEFLMLQEIAAERRSDGNVGRYVARLVRRHIAYLEHRTQRRRRGAVQ